MQPVESRRMLRRVLGIGRATPIAVGKLRSPSPSTSTCLETIEPGSFVELRGRPWLVEELRNEADDLLTLSLRDGRSVTRSGGDPLASRPQLGGPLLSNAPSSWTWSRRRPCPSHRTGEASPGLQPKTCARDCFNRIGQNRTFAASACNESVRPIAAP